MIDYIKKLNIETYRGIKNLEIENIGSVNIFVGDNNTGKTSVLEAIQLFCDPSEYGLIRIARQRDRYRASMRMSLTTLDSILFMFDTNSNFKEENNYKIKISGTIIETAGSLDISGNLVKELIDLTTLSESNHNARVKLRESTSNGEEEISTLIGYIKHSLNVDSQSSLFNDSTSVSFEVNEYSRFVNRMERKNLLNVKMIQTVDHVLQNSFSRIIRDKSIKDKAVAMLKKFDSTIEDVRYINDDNRYVPVLENSMGKYMPLSLYGDGIKKALTMLDAIVSAEGGVVLIDEFETALHTSAMKTVFRFILEAAQALKVQLFLTTHSIEAVDKLLECSNEYLNQVRVIRLKKTEDKTWAKVTNGVIALEDREEYNMELRI